MDEPTTAQPEVPRSHLLVPASIVIAGIIIAASVLYVGSFGARNSSGAAGGSGSGSQAAAAGAVSSDLADDDPALGNPSAPVTFVEFGDFQCPFCRRFFLDAEQKIIEQYVKTGKVRFVYRDFPLSSIHDQAQKAAEAAECADEQGKFWPYHDLLYQRQDQLGAENFKRWAAELGLNTAQFNACLDSGKYAQEVQKDFSDGQAAGASGTPSSFINGRLVSGALAFEQFERLIEEELAKR